MLAVPNSSKQPAERHEALKIAKKLSEWISLPNRFNWKVRSDDVIHRGRPLSLLRTKRRFPLPDTISSLKSRYVTITRQGFMVIYEDVSHGVIVDLRAAKRVFCTADKFQGKSGEYARCHLKIRLARGNIHLFVKDDEVCKWTNAVMQAASLMKGEVVRKTKTTKKNKMTMIAPCEPLVKQEIVSNIPEDVRAESPKTPSPVTVVERKSQEQQIHPVSVRSLREKLERELLIRTKSDVLADQMRLFKKETEEPSFISSFFLPYEPSSEDVIQGEDVGQNVFTEEKTVVLLPTEEEQEPRKDWWTRSLRC